MPSYVAILNIVVIGLLIYMTLDKRAFTRFMEGDLTTKELGSVAKHLYDIHGYEKVELIRTSKEDVPIFTVVLKDGTELEYFIFRKGFNNYLTAIINITSAKEKDTAQNEKGNSK